VSAIGSLTVKVTTPLLSEAPLAAEIVELPPLLPRATVLPETGLLFASSKVTVTVDAATPLAVTEAGLEMTLDWLAETGPGTTVKEELLAAERLSPEVRTTCRMTPLSAFV